MTDSIAVSEDSVRHCSTCGYYSDHASWCAAGVIEKMQGIINEQAAQLSSAKRELEEARKRNERFEDALRQWQDEGTIYPFPFDALATWLDADTGKKE